jgi:hypothetical protein
VVEMGLKEQLIRVVGGSGFVFSVVFVVNILE